MAYSHKNRISMIDHIIFITVTFIHWFSMFIYVPILPTYLETLGATYTFVGIVLGSYGLMQILVRLPLGIISDLMKVRRPFIIFGLLTGVLSCAGLAFTDELGWALGFRALAGVTASTWVAFTVLYSNFFPKVGSAQSMSILQFVVITSQILSMGLSGFLVNHWGWKFPFLIGGGVGFIGLVLSLFIKEIAIDSGRPVMKMSDVPTVMRNPLLLKVSLLSVFGHCILFVTMFGFTPSYALSIGAAQSDLGYISFAFLIPHAIASIVSGRMFVPLLGQWTTLAFGFLGSTIFTFMIPFVDHYGWLCFTQSLNGFFLGMTFPLLMSMSIESVPHEKRATAMGFYQSVYALGIVLGPSIAGWINHRAGMVGGFIFAALVGLIAMSLSYFGRNNFKYHVDNVINQ